MHSILATLALSVLATASPQNYGGGPATSDSSTPSSTSAAALPSASVTGQQLINVFPNTNLIFQPANITAAVNTTVTFAFPPGAVTHSVTQSTFAAPCNLMGESGNGTLGFDSGLTAGTQFTITITNASVPIWFFCKQFGPPSHCGSGMVGSINAPTTGNTFEVFQAAAKALGTSQTQDTHTGTLSGLGAEATAPPAVVSSKPKSGGSRLAASTASVIVVLGAFFTFLA